MSQKAVAVLLLALSADAQVPPQTGASSATFITLAAVGDIRLDGAVGNWISKEINPILNIKDLFKADLVFGNLECSLTLRGQKHPKKWNFRAPPASLKVLKLAGFNLLNIANNHVWDYGEIGFKDTLAALKKYRIHYIGGGKNIREAQTVKVFLFNGLRIGFIGLTSTFPQDAWAKKSKPGVAYSDFNSLERTIAKAKEDCDVLVVSFHGGTELAPLPNAIQKAFAHTAVDAGADLVLGHHPHVLQPLEIYQGKPVVHSLGNFLFVSPAPQTRATVVLRAKISRAGVEQLEFIPIDTNDGRPILAAPSLSQQAYAALNGYAALEKEPERYRLKLNLPSR